jgi:hypothetical protein
LASKSGIAIEKRIRLSRSSAGATAKAAVGCGLRRWARGVSGHEGRRMIRFVIPSAPCSCFRRQPPILHPLTSARCLVRNMTTPGRLMGRRGSPYLRARIQGAWTPSRRPRRGSKRAFYRVDNPNGSDGVDCGAHERYQRDRSRQLRHRLCLALHKPARPMALSRPGPPPQGRASPASFSSPANPVATHQLAGRLI